MTEIFDNINKMYQFSKPAEVLAPFIEFFSESLGAQNAEGIGSQPFSVRLFPSWTPTVWVNLGKPYILQMTDRTVCVHQYDDVLILRDGLVTRQNDPADHIFTIKFSPGGLETIFGIRQPLLVNKIISAATIIPGELMQKIKKQNGFKTRMLLLEAFFINQLQRQTPRDHYIKLVTDSVDFYSNAGMKYNTSQVAEKMFVTSKTINRYFHHTVGTSPKKYFSIIRARRAIAFYKEDRNNFDPTAHGYYDMSHFYKEAASFTGQRIAAKQ